MNAIKRSTIIISTAATHRRTRPYYYERSFVVFDTIVGVIDQTSKRLRLPMAFLKNMHCIVMYDFGASRAKTFRLVEDKRVGVGVFRRMRMHCNL